MHGQLAILSNLGHFNTNGLEWLFGPFGQFPTSPTPKFGPGGSGPLPLIRRFRAIQAPYGLRDTLGPLWPNSNEAKRGQGNSPEAPNFRSVPNHKWAHLSLFWPKIPKLAQGPKASRMAISLKTQAMASGNHKRPPSTFNKGLPLKIRETSDSNKWTQVCGNQEWCIYGIIYHYAPFFLSNSMVKF
ncbi:hypothetical protein O181_001621 [Austropuccinia psidii MF-1]|uniref:Uncharacterized protein n=1 Tax=Austropuccinia psidii MF-1 TaxID=1389203 RepID=A0A9Q3GCK6_9BASI|nr:hypothetical protein [Austropuccinia psidii MF-1]